MLEISVPGLIKDGGLEIFAFRLPELHILYCTARVHLYGTSMAEFLPNIAGLAHRLSRVVIHDDESAKAISRKS